MALRCEALTKRQMALITSGFAGKDDHIVLVPPVVMTLEAAMGWLQPGELMEVTPKVRIYLRGGCDAMHSRRIKWP